MRIRIDTERLKELTFFLFLMPTIAAVIELAFGNHQLTKSPKAFLFALSCLVLYAAVSFVAALAALAWRSWSGRRGLSRRAA